MASSLLRALPDVAVELIRNGEFAGGDIVFVSSPLARPNYKARRPKQHES